MTIMWSSCDHNTHAHTHACTNRMHIASSSKRQYNNVYMDLHLLITKHLVPVVICNSLLSLELYRLVDIEYKMVSHSALSFERKF